MIGLSSQRFGAAHTRGNIYVQRREEAGGIETWWTCWLFIFRWLASCHPLKKNVKSGVIWIPGSLNWWPSVWKTRPQQGKQTSYKNTKNENFRRMWTETWRFKRKVPKTSFLKDVDDKMILKILKRCIVTQRKIHPFSPRSPFISNLLFFPIPIPHSLPSHSNAKTYLRHIKTNKGPVSLPLSTRNCETLSALRIASVMSCVCQADCVENPFVMMTSLAAAQSCGDSVDLAISANRTGRYFSLKWCSDHLTNMRPRLTLKC